MTHPLKIIKDTVDGVEDIGVRTAAVVLFNTEGHNKLYPKDQRQLPSVADVRVREVHRTLQERLGTKIRDAGREIWELLSSLKLNENDDYSAFFANAQ